FFKEDRYWDAGEKESASRTITGKPLTVPWHPERSEEPRNVCSATVRQCTLYRRRVWNLLHPWLSNCEAKRCGGIALADESCSCGIARTDIGDGHCCNRSGRSANASLLRFVLRAGTHCSLSSFSSDRMANSQVFCCSSARDGDFGPAIDGLGKAKFS